MYGRLSVINQLKKVGIVQISSDKTKTAEEGSHRQIAFILARFCTGRWMSRNTLFIMSAVAQGIIIIANTAKQFAKEKKLKE